jgi:hypothetical protein
MTPLRALPQAVGGTAGGPSGCLRRRRRRGASADRPAARPRSVRTGQVAWATARDRSRLPGPCTALRRRSHRRGTLGGADIRPPATAAARSNDSSRMTARTVKRHADAARPEDLLNGQWHNRTSVLEEYKSSLDDRCNEGCTGSHGGSTPAARTTCPASAPRRRRRTRPRRGHRRSDAALELRVSGLAEASGKAGRTNPPDALTAQPKPHAVAVRALTGWQAMAIYELLLIGGGAGVGKTTIAWEVSAALQAKETAHCLIEGDYMDQIHLSMA